MEEYEGLTEEQRAHVLHAAMGALVELLTESPEVAKLPAGVIAKVFFAGLLAGVESLDRVLKVGLRDQLGPDFPGLPS